MALAVLATMTWAVACGGDDNKKSRDEGDAASTGGGDGVDAGTGGGGGSTGGTSGGGAGGAASGGGPATGGASPTDGGVEGGAGSPAAGVWEFSVEPGAQGLTGTGVSEQTTPESSIYVTNGGPAHIEGTNGQKITPADLGLAATDDVDGISYTHGFTLGEVLFSVEDLPSHDEGAPNTGVRDQSDLAEVPGDVFQTIGAGAVSLCIPGPCPPTPNSIVADDVFNGLQPLDLGGTPKDNLNALEEADHTPPIYFTVAASAEGLAGSAVASTAANERGCTIFRSMLDGENEVFASCDDIGLVPGDEVDALHAGTGASAGSVYLVFSVAPGATGKTGSGVNDLVTAPTSVGAHLFGTDEGGSNTLSYPPEKLGLQETDNVDALHLFDGFPDKFVRDDQCRLPLETPACNVGSIEGCAPLGMNTVLCYGRDATSFSDYGYCVVDLGACQYVANSYFLSVDASYSGPDAGGPYRSSQSFVVTSPVDMGMAPSGPPEVIHVFSAQGDGGDDVRFYRFVVDSGTTGPYDTVLLDVAPGTFVAGFAPRPLANGDLVAICVEDGPTPFVCSVHIDWTAHTATMTKLGQAPPPCRFGTIGTFVDQRVDGIDVVNGENVCQLDQETNLLEPARRWASRESTDPQAYFPTIEPGALAIDVANDSGATEVSFVTYAPAP